jgi:glucan biosynthesis protein C
MDPATPTRSAAQQRRQDLDLMRAAVVGGLIFYHTACIFSPGAFYIGNQESSLGMTAAVFVARLWALPLLFLVAGASIWHSLRARTTIGFVRERLRRLLVPFTVGVLLIVPPQIYYAARSSGRDPGSYWHFLAGYVSLRPDPTLREFVPGAGNERLFHTAHLWFLYYLLIYSALLLPVFLYLRRDPGRRMVEWLAARCRQPSGLVILALPVAVMEVLSDTIYAFALYLLYGFLLAGDRRLRQAVARNWKQHLWLGVAVLPVLFVIAHYDIGGSDRLLGQGYDPWSIVWRLLKALGGWGLTLTVFALAMSLSQRARAREPSLVTYPGLPDRARRALGRHAARCANEAVLPIYVLHQTPIVIIGFYVVQWRAGVLTKYLTISLASLAITLLVYDLLVRRFNVVRVLFGMNRMQPQTVAAERPAASSRR